MRFYRIQSTEQNGFKWTTFLSRVEIKSKLTQTNNDTVEA